MLEVSPKRTLWLFCYDNGIKNEGIFQKIIYAEKKKAWLRQASGKLYTL